MKHLSRCGHGTAARTWKLVLAAMTVASVATFAQNRPPPDLDRMVEYAQCIRANGYPEFPDPASDGRLQIRLDPKTAARFEAAQQACRDKAPPGMGGQDREMTPERMQSLLGFAACVRGRGVRGFPDPSPQGVFEINDPAIDPSAPQVRQAMEACTASHPPGALQIRRNRAR